MTEDRTWRDLVAEGDDIKRQLLDRAGGVIAAWQVSDRFGIDGGDLYGRTLMRKVIGFPVHNGHFYPVCQFDERGFVPGLEDALGVMPITAPWMRLEWLLTPDDALDGTSPLEALKEGRRNAVLDVARSHGTD